MPSSSLPPRKFAPTPVEITSKSSKDNPTAQQHDEEKVKPMRRFAPEPVETSTKSSKDVPKGAAETGDLAKPVRRFAPEPVETSAKSSKDAQKTGGDSAKPVRRFAPEPVGTSTKSSKGKNEEMEKEHKPRRFAPQPVETSHASSKDKKEEKAANTHIRFAPQLVETARGGNRSRKSTESSEATVETEKKAPRKFAPILIDTATRTRKNGAANPAITYADKTEEGHQIHAKEHRRHITGSETPRQASEDELDTHMPDAGDVSPTQFEFSHELRRQVSPMDGSTPHRPGLKPERQHSFRCPALDTIDSSESERETNPSSLASSPGQGSPITASDSSFHEFKHATRIRESVDENFSHYLLQLEAKRAEQRLREQALAAFPNSDFHEPVQHYVNDDKDSDSDMSIDDRPATWDGHEDEILVEKWRRESTKVPWEQIEMQRHAEEQEQQRKAAATTAKKEPTKDSPWWQPGHGAAAQPDQEMRSMRDRARPPMLGADIRFPRCPSPEPARFDVTQGSTALRNQMCYLTELADAKKDQGSQDAGLWHTPQQQQQFTSIKSPKPSAGSPVKGLWGGFCIGSEDDNKGGLTAPTGPTGLMTPRPESAGTANPFEQSFAVPGVAASATEGLKTPPTPPSSMKNADLGSIDSALNHEQELDKVMEQEYSDAFITQVYNYLSLGYPSLARPFDEELSKISRIAIADLRKDDQVAKATPRGYIRLGPDFEGGGGEGLTEDSCVRWQALKLYVREWARQEKNMVKVDGPGGNWGTGARRGSWAI